MMKPRVMILGLVTMLVLAGCTAGEPAARGGGSAADAPAPAAPENVIWASGKLLPGAVGRVEPCHGRDRESHLPGRG